MSTYSVRCRVAACRYRRVSRTHPSDYKVIPKCPKCGSGNGWRIESRDYNKRDLCKCSGPEASQEHGKNYPHNTTHPLCDNHPRGPYNQAKARGVADDDIPLEHVGQPMKETDDCPF